jgi:hypothetical protein
VLDGRRQHVLRLWKPIRKAKRFPLLRMKDLGMGDEVPLRMTDCKWDKVLSEHKPLWVDHHHIGRSHLI